VHGLRLTVYDNAAALIDHPPSRPRAFVWQQFVERRHLIGSLSWWCVRTLLPAGSWLLAAGSWLLATAAHPN
jgi:hypothetical protein